MKQDNHQVAQCPTCHKQMEQLDARHYFCKNCDQKYLEEYICPTCKDPLEQIKGCGSMSYLCRKDGLVSSSKIQYHYKAQ